MLWFEPKLNKNRREKINLCRFFIIEVDYVYKAIASILKQNFIFENNISINHKESP